MKERWYRIWKRRSMKNGWRIYQEWGLSYHMSHLAGGKTESYWRMVESKSENGLLFALQ